MKKVFKVLNKYNKNYLIKQDKSKQSLKALRKDFERQGLYKKINDDFDYLDFTVTRTSYENMKSIQDDFFTIKESLRDLWDVVKYRERHFLLYQELEEKVNALKSFDYEGKKYLITYFDGLINAYYNHDMLMFENEGYRKYLYDYKKILCLDQDFKTLAIRAGFAEVDSIYGDDEHYVLYNKAMRRFYCIKGAHKTSCGMPSVLSDADIEKLSNYLLAEDSEGFVTYLIDQGLVQKRLLKRLLKIQKKLQDKKI